MAEYQLTATDAVIRTRDGACIPPDDMNRDYADYGEWLAYGGVPDPYVESEPGPPPPPSPEQQVLFDHENRVRALEGSPPLTLEDFAKKLVPK